MDKSLASVVALNWNGLRHLETCLSSLCAQTYERREILLIDNGSSDASADYVEGRFPEVRVVRLPKNRGVSGGLNAGIAEAKGEFIALINNDTEADPAWLSESVKALEGHPEAGFTATRMRLFDRRTHLDDAGDFFFRSCYAGKRGRLMPDGPKYDANTWVFGACGGAAVYRRSMLDEVGFFDEDFYACFEDLDLSFRAQIMGYRCLYVGSAIIYHKVGGTLGTGLANPAQQFRAHRNRWYTVIKNLPASLWPRYASQIVAAEVLVMASAARTGRLGVLLRARGEVFRQMARLLAKRKAIQKTRRESVDYLDSLIRKDWFSFHMAEKRREADAAAQLP